MITKIMESIKLLFTLFDEIQRLRDKQRQFDERLEAEKHLRNQDTQAIRDLTHELLRLRDHDQHEREKLMLRLENELLKFERRLPPKSD